jgi:hypothetical protein
MPEAAIEQQNAGSTESFEHVIHLLEDSHRDLEQAVLGLSNELCARKPSDDCWSITDVVEHLVIIEGRVSSMLQTKLAEQPFTPGVAHLLEQDAKLVKQVASPTVKINAPDAVKPIGKYQNCRQALDNFSAVRQRTLEYARSATPYLRGRLLPHPILGPIDGCQWLLALAAHTQRHVKQIQGMIATAN